MQRREAMPTVFSCDSGLCINLPSQLWVLTCHAAVKRINRPNVPWTASLATAFEGVKIKQFGRRCSCHAEHFMRTESCRVIYGVTVADARSPPSSPEI